MRLRKIVEAADAVASFTPATRSRRRLRRQRHARPALRRPRAALPRDRERRATSPWCSSTGQGDCKDKGLNRLGARGPGAAGDRRLLRPDRRSIEQLIVDNRIEAYNLPEGVMTQLYRDIGARKPGTLSRVGLGTFIDPRHGGGRINERTTEDIVQLVEIDGGDYLFFKAFPIHVALIRGTTADPDGNVTMERESLRSRIWRSRSPRGIRAASSARRSSASPPRARSTRATSRFPGILVDCVVLAEPEHHMQTYGTHFNPAFSGEMRVPLERVRGAAARRAQGDRAPRGARARAEQRHQRRRRLPGRRARCVASEERVHDLMTLDRGLRA